jgi:hypothetical protein
MKFDSKKEEYAFKRLMNLIKILLEEYYIYKDFKGSSIDFITKLEKRGIPHSLRRNHRILQEYILRYEKK